MNRKLVANARGRYGLLELNVANAFFVVFRFKYSIIKSLCWLPCSRLHSNTQFEAKVRELLKDRLDLESSTIFSQRENKIALGCAARS